MEFSMQRHPLNCLLILTKDGGIEGAVKVIFSLNTVLNWFGFALIFKRENSIEFLDLSSVIEKDKKLVGQGLEE